MYKRQKYYYGDPSVIEEVKKRERKVLKDISTFKRQIAEIEDEIDRLTKKVIPQLKYDLNKKSLVFKNLKRCV